VVREKFLQMNKTSIRNERIQRNDSPHSSIRYAEAPHATIGFLRKCVLDEWLEEERKRWLKYE
jgi:hypothetical protein